MATCQCIEYEDLEMLRKVISKRINESKTLKKLLRPIAKSSNKEHQLWCCDSCGQAWQSSRAWNWGNELYLFKIPDISVQDWLEMTFVQADELLIYVSGMDDFLSQNLEVGIHNCKESGCVEKAISGLSLCLKHHVENLQSVHRLPQDPVGRWFSPYFEENFKPTL